MKFLAQVIRLFLCLSVTFVIHA